MSEEYSEKEKAIIRSQLREGSRIAREAAMRRGLAVHPRVTTIKLVTERWLQEPTVKEAAHRRPIP